MPIDPINPSNYTLFYFFNLIKKFLYNLYTSISSILSFLISPIVNITINITNDIADFFETPDTNTPRSRNILKEIKNIHNQSVATILSTSGEGNNCLFRSVAHHTNNLDPAALRQQVCDYINNNSRTDAVKQLEILKISRTDLEFDTLEEYLKLMRGSVYAGELEIKALTEILNRDIIVLRRRPEGDTATGYTAEIHGPYQQGERNRNGRFPQVNPRAREADGPPIVIEYDGSSHYSRVNLAEGVTAIQLIQFINHDPSSAQKNPLLFRFTSPELKIIREHCEQERSRQWLLEKTGRSLAIIPYTNTSSIKKPH